MAHILVVDDDEMFLDIYGEILTDEGHDVVLAQSGQEALDAASAQVPDIIMMDLNMRGMNGIEAIRKFRERDALRTTPILAVTAENAVHVYDEIYEAGANGYLAKPIDTAKLRARIKEMLKS